MHYAPPSILTNWSNLDTVPMRLGKTWTEPVIRQKTWSKEDQKES